MSEEKKKAESPKNSFATTSSKLRLEFMDDCECKSNEKSMYLCSDMQCPNREIQPFYCQMCLYEKHKHMPLLIGIEIDKQATEWNTIRENLVAAFPILKEKYEKYKPVITYLENANMNEKVLATT
jgi:hypothetical protein